MDISSSMVNTLMPAPAGLRPKDPKLTEEQKLQVNDILSNYDANNFNQDDFEEIFSQFQEQGIPLGSSLKALAEENGFDFDPNIQQAIEDGTMPPPPEGQRPPPPNNSNTESTDYSSQLAELLTAYKNGEADQSDFEAFIQEIKRNNSSAIGNIYNQSS